MVPLARNAPSRSPRPAPQRTVWVLHGPNLNLLGRREPGIYGSTTLAEIDRSLEAGAQARGARVVCRQSNREGELIDWVHEAAATGASGIVINPAGYTFTSIALLDSLKMFNGPKIELHISNVHTRESIYHHSLISRTATGLVVGFGAFGYELALEAMNRLVSP